MNINVERAKNGYIVCIDHEDRFVFQKREDMIKAVLDAVDLIEGPMEDLSNG